MTGTWTDFASLAPGATDSVVNEMGASVTSTPGGGEVTVLNSMTIDSVTQRFLRLAVVVE